MKAPNRTTWLLVGCLLILGSPGCTRTTSSASLVVTTPSPPSPTAVVISSPIAPTPTPPPAQSPVTPTKTPAPSPTAVSEPETFVRLDFNRWELVLALAWSPDGKTLAVSAGEFIYLYETNTFNLTGSLETGVWSPGLTFSPDGEHLASGGRDGRLSVWDAATGQRQLTIQAHKKGVNSVTFSPDGSLLASGGNDAVARLWDPVSGENIAQMIGGTFAVPAIAFAPNGASLAIVNGDVIRLRDVASGRFVQTFRGDEAIYSAVFTPDGEVLATGSSLGTVTLWQVSSGVTTQTFQVARQTSSPNSRLVWHLAFDPKGSRLAAVTGEGMVSIWNISTGLREITWLAHTLAASAAAFSPDGRLLATGGLDGSVRVWIVAP